MRFFRSSNFSSALHVRVGIKLDGLVLQAPILHDEHFSFESLLGTYIRATEPTLY